MSWKFNPPPGWPPQPEGWQPPPGWAPDPSWPPAPADWQFWVPTQSVPPPTAPVTQPFTSASDQSPFEKPPAGQSPFASSSGQSPFASSSDQPPFGGPAAAGPYHPGAGFGGSYLPAKPWYRQKRTLAIGGAVAGLVLLLAGLVGVGTFMLLSRSDQGDEPTSQPSEPQPSPSIQLEDEPDEPYDWPAGSGDAQTYQGEGDETIALDLTDGECYTVSVTHTGSDDWVNWFEVWTVYEGEDEYILGWGSGDHSGVYAIGLYQSDPVDGLRIQTTGSWTVEVRTLDQSPSWPEVNQGTGPAVLVLDLGGEQVVNATHDGDSNFVVWAYTEDGIPSLLYNEIGAVDGAAVLPAGTFALTIEADGEWTLQER